MRIWIDAGHGWENRSNLGYDPGACANGATEADTVLTLALTGKWLLESRGFDVFMSRDDDKDSVPVGMRASRAARAGCTLGISLHMNAGSPLATGTETFYRDAADKRWALEVQSLAIHSCGLRDRGVKGEGQSQHPHLAVMDFQPPMCLLEAGFITNRNDLRRVNTRDNRIKFWNSIAAHLDA